MVAAGCLSEAPHLLAHPSAAAHAWVQGRLRQEAALSQVEEQRRSRDAVEAANAANLAKLAENDAMVRTYVWAQ